MAQTSAGLVVKKKKWVTILAPKIFNEMPLGETRVAEIEEAVGRKATVSAMVITGDPQKQSINVEFLVKSSSGDSLQSDVTGYEISPSAVRKMVRRGREKIEESFEAKTADGIKIRIKPVLITRNKTKGSVLKQLRKTARENVLELVSKSSFDALVKDLMLHKFQKSLSDALRKIYPLSICEIKHVSIVREKTAEEKLRAAGQEA